MLSGTIAWLLGIVSAYTIPQLSNGIWVFLPLCVVVSLWQRPISRLFIVFCCGFFWAYLQASYHFSQIIPMYLEGEDLVVEGRVCSLVRKHNQYQQFRFCIQSVQDVGKKIGWKGETRLRCYRCSLTFEPGEQWRIHVRLKQPRGLINPGTFNYEAWLHAQGIVATGYVRNAETSQLIGQPNFVSLFLRLRSELAQAITDQVTDATTAGFFTALAIGTRDGISAQQYQRLIQSGTLHLIVISGLHIGLVVGISFWLVQKIWWLFPWLIERIQPTRAAALVSLFVAAIYLAMAGFSVPTQRAFISCAVMMGALFLRREVSVWRVLALALLSVTWFDPASVCSQGFWLSFGAVAIIFRIVAPSVHTTEPTWRKLLKVQFLLNLGLVPLQVYFFSQLSLVAPLANLVAVPLLGFVVVPSVLASSLLLLIYPPLAEWVVPLATISIRVLVWLIEQAAQLDLVVSLPKPHLVLVFVGAVGVLWCLLPRGFPARWLGLVLLVPLFVGSAPLVRHGDFRFILFDVGQGLAAGVRTKNHFLVFDAGPGFPSGFNTGRAVIAPYMRAQGISVVDRLIISHGDNDHIGGLLGLLSSVVVTEVLTSVPGEVPAAMVRPCQLGTRWQWDGVEFEFLHPKSATSISHNNYSCVLRVQNQAGSLLLTGDIEKKAEHELVQRFGDRLHADVLVVAHHGSATSSIPSFVDAVAPRFALIPLGYRNRFGFPKATVLQTLRDHNASVIDTAQSGAIEFYFTSAQGIVGPEIQRSRNVLLDSWLVNLMKGGK